MTGEQKNENNFYVLSISIIIGFLILSIFTYLGLDSINQAVKETNAIQKDGLDLQKKYFDIQNRYLEGNNNLEDTQEQPQLQPTPGPIIQATPEDDPVLGDKNAPVTIIEFSDFECPFCARFYNDAYKQIRENYVKTGKVKIVFRDFPLNFHQYAQKAAEASECADEQGKYWEYHDLLFEKQSEWSRVGIEKFKEYAKTLGLDEARFNSCLDSGKYAGEVQKDFQDGQIAGVSGTPSFFINGKLVVGAQPYSVFQQAIEEALSKK